MDDLEQRWAEVVHAMVSTLVFSDLTIALEDVLTVTQQWHLAEVERSQVIGQLTAVEENQYSAWCLPYLF